MKIKTTITKLETPVRSGDWHDAPARWKVETNNEETSLFTTKKEATLYARIRRVSTSFQEAGRVYAKS